MNHAANKTAEEKGAFPAKPVRKGAHKDTSDEKSGKDHRGGNKPQRPAFTNQVELLRLKRPTHIRRNSLSNRTRTPIQISKFLRVINSISRVYLSDNRSEIVCKFPIFPWNITSVLVPRVSKTYGVRIGASRCIFALPAGLRCDKDRNHYRNGPP